MAELQIMAFEPGHLEQLAARNFEAREMALVGDARRRAREYQRRGLAYTGLINGEILACGGLVMLWPGVAELWMVTTHRVERYPLAFHRAVVMIIEALKENCNLHRLQAIIHVEHQVSHKWIRRLGFNREGMRRQYGPDRADYLEFAWLRRTEAPVRPPFTWCGEEVEVP